MERSSGPDLVARVARLESSSRRDRAIVLAVALLALATAQAPGPGSTPVVIRDSSGSSATLTGKGLTVRDAAGHERAFIGIDADNRPSVDLGDSTGRLRESMYLLNELPVLRQFDTAGKRRAEIRLDASNDGELLLNDANEKLRAYFATDDDSPYLVMRDNAGTTRIYAGGYKDGTIGLDIRNASNTVLWKAP